MRQLCEKETTAKVDQLWITWRKIPNKISKGNKTGKRVTRPHPMFRSYFETQSFHVFSQQADR